MIWLISSKGISNLAPKFPSYARTAASIARLDGVEAHAWDEEEVQLGNAVKERRREYAVGRSLARQSMAALGLRPCPIPRRGDRSPIWPLGVRGSISHCRHLAVAAVSTSMTSIGIDIECTHRLPPHVLPQLFTANEMATHDSDPMTTICFSAKEAAFKAVYPLLGHQIEFDEAEILLDMPRKRFEVRYVGHQMENQLMDRIEGSFGFSGDHVLTLAVLR